MREQALRTVAPRSRRCSSDAASLHQKPLCPTPCQRAQLAAHLQRLLRGAGMREQALQLRCGLRAARLRPRHARLGCGRHLLRGGRLRLGAREALLQCCRSLARRCRVRSRLDTGATLVRGESRGLPAIMKRLSACALKLKAQPRSRARQGCPLGACTEATLAS